MSDQQPKKTGRATRSLFNIKKNRRTSSVEPTPLSMKVININNFKNLLKKQPVKEWPEQIYRNRVETAESKYFRGSTPSQNKIYIKHRKQAKNDEFNFSDYKIKFGKDVKDFLPKEWDENEQNYTKYLNCKNENEEEDTRIKINNYFNEAINQKPIEMTTKEIFKPKGRIIFKRQSMSKSQRRSNLPVVKANSSYQHYRKRANILEENQNELDGWKDQNPMEEELDSKMDISNYTGKWELKYQYIGKAKR